MSTVTVETISKTYRHDFWAAPVTAVDALSFRLDKPEITGFVGPNGAGKTTTIKMILGLVRPDRGRVLIDDCSASDPCSRRSLSYLGEQPYFYDYLTVVESMRFAGQLKGIEAAILKRQIPDTIDRLGLSEHASKKVRALSKGNQQRLNFAQALLGSPSLFILDEPMSGLDPLGRRLFRELFRELAKDGKSIFFSTHILEDIESLCERVIVLSRGRKGYDGPIATILDAGFTGTELSVPRLTDDLHDRLSALGCTMNPLPDGTTTVFVSRDQSVGDIQRLLAEKNIFCGAVTRCNGSLETILYKDTPFLESL